MPPSKGQWPTEQRNRASRNLDRLSTLAILRVTNREDKKVAAAVGRELRSIARAVDAIVASLGREGRLFYVGAGTSGRLAVLDAAECPPTFGVAPRTVQAVMAGGRRALFRAIEDAEDSSARGMRDLKKRKVTSQDVVVGLAASGVTPYVLGAIGYARRCKAMTVGVTSNAGSPLARLARIPIVVDVGPEVLAGSSRMKAGTAQKMVLNMLSTTAMARLGKVYDNWMIRMSLSNRKLRERGLHLLMEASGCGMSAAGDAMRQSRHDLRIALLMLKRGIGARGARAALARARGNLRAALGE